MIPAVGLEMFVAGAPKLVLLNTLNSSARTSSRRVAAMGNLVMGNGFWERVLSSRTRSWATIHGVSHTGTRELTSMAPARDPYLVKSVVHSSRVLSAFRASGEALPLREIAARSGLPK